jgi:hypothetical protein
MSDILIDITIKDGTATYDSKSPEVQPDGTITIELGEDATITFQPASGQSWTFSTPGIVVVAQTPGIDDVSIVSQSATSVVIEDNNPANTQASNYEYTLKTTAGDLDPAIINKGR